EAVWARTDLNRRPTGYEPVALSRTKLRAHRRGRGGAAERSLGATAEHRCPFEPLTFRLTADRSAAELRRHRGCRAGIALIAFPARRRPVLVLDGSALEVLDDRGHPFERPVEVRPELLRFVGDHGTVRGGLDDALALEQVERVPGLVDGQLEGLAQADDPDRRTLRELLQDVDVAREEVELLFDALDQVDRLLSLGDLRLEGA